MRKGFELLFLAGLLAPAGSAQALLDQVNFKASQLGGLQLIGVSVYSGYSTSAYPDGGFALNNSNGAAPLGGDATYGASASVGWQRHLARTDFSALYTGSYSGMVRNSGLNALNHSLSISAARKLTPRWTFEFSASAQDATLAQVLYQPSSLSVLSVAPATFDDLAAALSAGQFTSAQAASILTGTPILQTPGRNVLVGDRILSYTAQAGVNYAFSSRLHMHFGSFAAAGQTRLGGQDNVAPSNYVMPRTLGGDAGMGLSYSLSPRTDVGFDLGVNRTQNRIQTAYVNTATAFVSRKMGTHWFLRLQGGGAYSVITDQTTGSPKTRQIIGGGSLGFQARTHTLIGSYTRSAADTFGFAVGAITSEAGAWSWRQPGSRWGLFASFSEQQTRNTGFSSLTGWQAAGGVTARLDSHATLSAQYVYLSNSGTYLGTFNNLAIHSVRLSLGWSPQAIQR